MNAIFRIIQFAWLLSGLALVVVFIMREFTDHKLPKCLECAGFLAPSDVVLCRGCLHV